MKIANNFDEFVNKVLTASTNTLNSENGQQLVEALLKQSLANNPNLTDEEWAKIKQDFLAYMFFTFIKENPELFKEFGEHTYNALREKGKDKE